MPLIFLRVVSQKQPLGHTGLAWRKGRTGTARRNNSNDKQKGHTRHVTPASHGLTALYHQV